MAGGFPCSSASEKKTDDCSYLRGPGSCKPEASEGVNFHPRRPPKKKRKKQQHKHNTFKANLVG